MVTSGNFQLTITSAGFATQTFSGTLASGENYIVPQIALDVATAITEVQVGLTQTEVAQEEIKQQEKQRVLGLIPNFYVSYVPNAVPLTSKQKFGIAWKTVIDPVTFILVGGLAGVQQAQNHFEEYGQGIGRLCQTLWRRLCRHSCGHFHRKRHLAVASETGSALFL